MSSVLVDAADVVIFLSLICEISRVILVMDSVLVNISGTVAKAIHKTSNSAKFDVLLAKVNFRAISGLSGGSVAANGTSITVGKSVSEAGADSATVAGISTVSRT